MATYQSKRCPHCGIDYKGINYAGVQSKNNQIKYGSPLKVCPVCEKEFLDEDYCEIAIEGIRDVDMERVSSKDLFYGFIGVFIGIGAVCYEMYGGIIAALLGIFIPVSELFSYEKRQKELEIERNASEERLRNSNYAITLKRLGHNVPEKYLPSNEEAAKRVEIKANPPVSSEKIVNNSTLEKTKNPVTTFSETSDPISYIRENIIKRIEECPSTTYTLTDLLWEKAAACFPSKNSWNWDGAWFTLNLKTMKLYAKVATYPNQFGASMEDIYHLTASEFHQKAREFNFPLELQKMKTEDDWRALFNEELKNAVDRAEKILNKQEEERKEEERLQHAVVIPEKLMNIRPTLELSEIWLKLSQRHGYNHVHLTKEDGKYKLEYRYSAHFSSLSKNHNRQLTSAEAVWVEQKVRECIENQDHTTWQSLAGGDTMNVIICIDNVPCIELSREKPVKKYTDLKYLLQDLTIYGSITEREASEKD